MSLSYTTIIDIVAISLILIFAVVGTFRGFSKTFLSTFGSIIALICAALLCSSTTATLEKSFGAVTFFANKSAGAIAGIFGEDILNATVGQVNSGAVPNVPMWLTNIIKNLLNSETIDASITLRDVLAPIFGYYITLFISLLVLYVLFKIALFLIGRFLNKITKIRIIGRIDRILGFFLGIIKGMIVVQLIIAVMNVIPLEFLQKLSLEIGKSQVCTFLNKINLINIIVDAFINPEFILNIIKRT